MAPTIKMILNRREKNKKLEFKCQEKGNYTKYEYYVEWSDGRKTWKKFKTLTKKIVRKIDEFEEELDFEHMTRPMKKGLRAIRINGMAKHENQNLFMCEFLNVAGQGIVEEDMVYQKCPDVALRFFEKHLTFPAQGPAKVVIPLEMQQAVIALKNNNNANIMADEDSTSGDESDDADAGAGDDADAAAGDDADAAAGDDAGAEV